MRQYSGTDIATFHLEISAAKEAQYAAYLSAEETQRANSFHFARDKARFIAARGQLREMLAQKLEVSPHEVCVVYDTNGKPRLNNKRSLEFNLSHSGAFAICAISEHSAVGIDLEFLPRHRNYNAIAARVMTPQELKNFSEIQSISEQKRYFLDLWTTKEALMKYFGLGFQLPPTCIQVFFGEYSTDVWFTTNSNRDYWQKFHGSIVNISLELPTTLPYAARLATVPTAAAVEVVSCAANVVA